MFLNVTSTQEVSELFLILIFSASEPLKDIVISIKKISYILLDF